MLDPNKYVAQINELIELKGFSAYVDHDDIYLVQPAVKDFIKAPIGEIIKTLLGILNQLPDTGEYFVETMISSLYEEEIPDFDQISQHPILSKHFYN